MKRETFNWVQAKEVMDAFEKRAFLPMPAGQSAGGAPPVAGAGPMTDALGAPMGGAPMDPAAAMGGMPMDPAMMGGAPPMDPAMMGGAPPMDPAAMGMPPLDPSAMGGLPPPAGQVVMSIPELITLIQAVKGGGGGGGEGASASAEAKPKTGGKAELSSKVDQILQLVGGSGQAAPAAPAAPAGGPPTA